MVLALNNLQRIDMSLNKETKPNQEQRYNHRMDLIYDDTGNGWTFVTASASKNSVNATKEGVVMLIGPRALK